MRTIFALEIFLSLIDSVALKQTLFLVHIVMKLIMGVIQLEFMAVIEQSMPISNSY